MSRPQIVLAIIIAAAVAAAVCAAAVRWQAEMPNRSAALILDLQEVQALAAAEGLPVQTAMLRLRRAGATAVALSEEHLSDLTARGQVSALSMDAAGFEEETPGEGVVLSAYDTATAERLRAHLSAKLPPRALKPPPGAAEATPLLVPCRASAAHLEMLGLGWPEEAPLLIADAGLRVVARIDNYPGARSEGITFMAAQASAADADLVVFSRDQVLGYPGLIGDTAEALQAAGLRYGSVEMAGQLGDGGLGRALDGELVRVHSITENEILGMSPAVAIARYVRAVKERGIRACYVRLFIMPHEEPLEFNERYVTSLKRELADAGYDVGRPQLPEPVAVPRWGLVLMAAGAVAAALFALAALMPLAQWLVYLLLVVGLGAGAALFVVAPDMARAEKALLAALAFPTIALIAVARGARTARAAPDVTAAGLAARAAGWLVGACVVSGAGGLVVSGLLTERLYMTHVLQFTGVKLALGLPVLVVGVVWTLGLFSDRDAAAYQHRVQENFRRAWNRPVYVWEAVLAAVLLAAVAVMLMRSGNQPAVEVSGLEMRARGILEQIFFARPRTKEFLVGHPALMLAVGMALRGRTRWVLLFLLLGAVGQTSLVNTFCHLHTPVFTSLLRSAHGLWLGLAIGAVAVWLWDRLRGTDAAEALEEHTTGS